MARCARDCLCVQYDSFVHVTWLLHIHDMTHAGLCGGGALRPCNLASQRIIEKNRLLHTATPCNTLQHGLRMSFFVSESWFCFGAKTHSYLCNMNHS